MSIKPTHPSLVDSPVPGSPIKLSLTTNSIFWRHTRNTEITVKFHHATQKCIVYLVHDDPDFDTLQIGEDALAAMLWLACNTGISHKGILQKLLKSITEKGDFYAIKNKWLYQLPPQLLTPEKDDQPPEPDENSHAKFQPDDPLDPLERSL